MAEKEGKDGKDLALEEKHTKEIEETINTALLNNKERVILSDGTSFIPIRILDAKDDESKKIEFGGKVIATVKKGEKVPADSLKKQIQRYQSRFNFNKLNKDLGRVPLEKERQNKESLKLEAELKRAIESGNATKLRTAREITDGENLSLMFHRMFGERTHEIYRVRDSKDSHKFKYIGKNSEGKFIEPRGKRANEGDNPTQNCWVQNNDGTFEKKPVDDMKVFGRYALATDLPESTISEHTRTLVGVRTPKGEYIFMPALDNRIIDASQNKILRDNLTRGNSVWDIEDIVLAANLSKTIYGTKKDGKLSVEEVEFVRKLQKEGLKDEKVKKVVDLVLIVGELEDQDLKEISIKNLLNSLEKTKKMIETLKRENYTQNEIKEIISSVHKDDVSFEEAKSEVDKEKAGEGQKIRGERPEGPWDIRK